VWMLINEENVRYTNPVDFQEQYEKCVTESWR
jgi:hypothetical protein